MFDATVGLLASGSWIAIFDSFVGLLTSLNAGITSYSGKESAHAVDFSVTD